ncbi:MAG: tRNA dihydrouridine synthase DusB [Armatimonadetes bacterium]|nr:tRNA dihydrouridine synthase DusB [Armatimonadota bacterium]
MAGHTNHAFRRLCRELGGCGLVCTELISSKALQHRSSRTRALDAFDWSPEERPLAVQLFGNEAAEMAEAARIVVDRGAQLVDINMGCWVPKVARKGGGAGMLRDLSMAVPVIRAVVAAVPVPVTVKIRSGLTRHGITAVEFARAAEAEGVRGIAVHARTADQGFAGAADWSVVRQVKEAVSVPVLGNGDVSDAAEARQMFDETGCDAVMIGRAALGNPWIFRQVHHELATGERLPRPSRAERAAVALRHARLTRETSPLRERQALMELRGQLSRYALDLPGSREIRDRLVRLESYGELEELLAAVNQCTTLSVGGWMARISCCSRRV